MDMIPSEKLFAVSNVDNISQLLHNPPQIMSYYEMYYYYKQNTEIDPVRYVLDTGDEEYTSISLLYEPSDSIDTLTYSQMEFEYSDWSPDLMRRIGSYDKFWNDDVVHVQYDDGSIQYGKSDYYTNQICQKLLFSEAYNAIRSQNKNFPIRDLVLSTEEHIHNPRIARAGGVNGVVVSVSEDSARMLLGRRSNEVGVYQELIDTVPSGGADLQDFDDGAGFNSTVRRELQEEAMCENAPHSLEDFSYVPVLFGSILDSGTIIAGYTIITDPEQFAYLKNHVDTNFEYEECIEIDLMDTRQVVQMISSQMMTPSAMPTAFNTLSYINNNDELPSLPYSINRI